MFKRKNITWEVDENGCWICTSHVPDLHGYPTCKRNHKKTKICKVFYEEYKNTTVSKELCLCHKCDNRMCINPDHIFLGTKSDNSKDMVSKNRQAKGEGNKNSKLTEEQVREIKFGCTGMKYTEIAMKFNIAANTVGYIKSNRLWSHIKEE